MIRAASRPRILFDAGRLFDRGEREAPTGVDRVCLAYAEWLTGRSDLDVIPVTIVRDDLRRLPVDRYSERIASLRARWTGEEAPMAPERRIVRALQAGRASRSVMDAPPEAADDAAERGRRALRRIWGSRPMTQGLRGTIYLNVGHTGLNRPALLESLRRRGVRPVVLIHDLIPITHPEYCRPGEADRHRARMSTALNQADRILVNSQHTAARLAAFATSQDLAAPPLLVAPLGLEPMFGGGRAAVTQVQIDHPYFLHVGTIEARKNLAFLLSLWRRLEERLGPETPALLLVGRYGWENEAVLDHLQRSPNLQGLVHQISTLSDLGLARLMGGARAVLAPSAEEGFDLPAVEAMATRTPLIASDIPVHRELVPQAKLIDPLDGPGWLKALEAATHKSPKAPAYAAPTWAAHFDGVSRFLGLQSA